MCLLGQANYESATFMDKISSIVNTFNRCFNTQPSLFRSPGRINLIGEHTDYNNGLVLPAAINRYIYLAIAIREDEEVHIYSVDYEDLYVSTLSTLTQSGKLWPDYINGVIQQILVSGKKLTGVNIVFGGDIPQGAGLSSSAAIECATAYALNSIFDLGFSSLEIAKLGQAAENHFVGVNCGLMDQFASVFGKANNLIKFDCESFDYDYLPFISEEYSLVLFDTQIKHSLASSAYNERRSQCERGVELIRKHYPEITSLRDINHQMLEKYVRDVDRLVYDRCHYVVSEIQRLQDATEDLMKGDFEQFGKRMFETHEGLKTKYEVSCPELDFLVDFVRKLPDVIGARMMGGGFGGCTINLIRNESLERIVEETLNAYKTQLGLNMKVYRVELEDGTRRIN